LDSQGAKINLSINNGAIRLGKNQCKS